MIRKLFSCKNKHYIVIVPVPNLYLSAWSSLFIMYFFFTFMENLLRNTLDLLVIHTESATVVQF